MKPSETEKQNSNNKQCKVQQVKHLSPRRRNKCFTLSCCITVIKWRQLCVTYTLTPVLTRPQRGKGSTILVWTWTGCTVAGHPPVYQSSEHASARKNSSGSPQRDQWTRNNATRAGENALAMNWPQLVHVFLLIVLLTHQTCFFKALKVPVLPLHYHKQIFLALILFSLK